MFVITHCLLAFDQLVTAVPVSVPSTFNTLFPPEAAVYHPSNVYPSLVTVGTVLDVAPVAVVYKFVP